MLSEIAGLSSTLESFTVDFTAEDYILIQGEFPELTDWQHTMNLFFEDCHRAAVYDFVGSGFNHNLVLTEAEHLYAVVIQVDIHPVADGEYIPRLV